MSEQQSIPDLKRTFHKAINNIQVTHWAKKEQSLGSTSWDISGSLVAEGQNSYEQTFKVFGEEPIMSFLREQGAAGIEPVVLDLAGGNGLAIRALKADNEIGTGLTVNLTDIRTERESSYDADANIGYIHGDLFRSKTWDKIRTWLQQNRESNPKFDMILCRPMSGFPDNMPDWVYKIMLKRASSVLSSNGMLLTQIPQSIPKKKIPQYMTELQKMGEIEYDANQRVLKMRKVGDSNKQGSQASAS